MKADRQKLIDAMADMNAKQLALFSIAMRAVTTLPPEQSQDFHDLVVNRSMSIPEAAAKFGIGIKEKEAIGIGLDDLKGGIPSL